MTNEAEPLGRSRPGAKGQWSPWQTVFGFGLVSLCADMVYEGMRAMAGPLLGSLGASALMVGFVTGAGEAVSLILRLFTGSWADRAQLHWPLTVAGYAMTAICVPLLAVTPFLGGAGLAVAATLILLERAGKAVRSPAKSALLARMAKDTGRGKGFGVHKALDQIGAFSGPLLLAGVAALTGVLWPGFALLAVPGVACLLLLALLRARAPIAVAVAVDPVADQGVAQLNKSGGFRAFLRAGLGQDLPRRFHMFSIASALTTAGLMTFGVLSFHFVEAGIASIATVPLVYALGMAVAAVGALATGALFDRRGAAILLLVPPLVAAVPLLVFGDSLAGVLVGVAVWGMAGGIQDSTVKAFVADLVPGHRRASAYGVFGAVQGVGALAGGAAAGALVTHHTAALSWLVVGVQAVAFVLLAATMASASPPTGRSSRRAS